MAYFVETCNNTRIYGDYLINQYVCLLKKNVFDWYTDLKANPIDSCEQLKQEFLHFFYNTPRSVSMIELFNLSQKKNNPLLEYINNWRNLSLNYKEICLKLLQLEYSSKECTAIFSIYFKESSQKLLKS